MNSKTLKSVLQESLCENCRVVLHELVSFAVTEETNNKLNKTKNGM